MFDNVIKVACIGNVVGSHCLGNASVMGVKRQIPRVVFKALKKVFVTRIISSTYRATPNALLRIGGNGKAVVVIG